MAGQAGPQQMEPQKPLTWPQGPAGCGHPGETTHTRQQGTTAGHSHGAAKLLFGCTALQSPSTSSTSCCPCPRPGSAAKLLLRPVESLQQAGAMLACVTRPLGFARNITCSHWCKASVRGPAAGTTTAEGDQRAEVLC